MARGTASNVVALVVVLLIAIAGLWWISRGPDSDDCQRWQALVRNQSQLLAKAGEPPMNYYESAANTYADSRPEGCALPS